MSQDNLDFRRACKDSFVCLRAEIKDDLNKLAVELQAELRSLSHTVSRVEARIIRWVVATGIFSAVLEGVLLR